MRKCVKMKISENITYKDKLLVSFNNKIIDDTFSYFMVSVKQIYIPIDL